MTELVLEDADRWLHVSLERRRMPPGVKYGTELLTFFLESDNFRPSKLENLED